jgi:oxygen-independent coproporphyrinogen-3 oxidase
VRDAVHRNRFGRSLLAPPWRDALDSLVSRGLARLDDAGVTLTPDGEVLVEAVINTELDVAD